MYKKEYFRGTSVEMCITQISDDDKTRRALVKRIKGKNFDDDKNNLMKLAGLDEAKASDFAYIISEAAAWQEFERLLSASGGVSDGRIAEVLEYINTAVTVEETPKITINEQTDAMS